MTSVKVIGNETQSKDEKDRLINPKNILRSEQIYGRGYQRPGGLTTCLMMLDELRLKDLDAKKFQILDIGCGLGGDVSYIAESFDIEKIIGLDVSPTMVKMCQDRYGKNKKLEFVCGDVCDKKLFKENQFDLILSRDCFMYISDRNSLWNNIYYWLKPSGTMYVTDFGSRDHISEDFKEHIDSCGYNLFPLWKNAKDIESVGFKSLTVSNISELFIQYNKKDLASFMDKKRKFF